MEEDKKKKRNKKKKNKQNKFADDAVAAEETSSGTKNQLSNGKDVHEELSDSVDAGSSNVDSNAHQTNGAATNVFEETINQLKRENELNLRKQKIFEERILFLEKRLESASQKETVSQALILKLREDNKTYLQEQVPLEETIDQLCSEKESHREKQARLEMIILRLQNEKDSMMQVKVGLEETIKQSLLEKESLEKRIELLEKELDSSATDGNAAKETAAKLRIAVSRLQMQVVELEHSKSTLLQENQELTGDVLLLQSTVANLEKRCSSLSSPDTKKDQTLGDEDLNSQLEAAFALVEKLITENAELVEKVAELYAKLDQQRKWAVDHENSEPMLTAENAAKIDVPHAMPVEEFESLEVVHSRNASNNDLVSKANDEANSSRISDPEVVVSVPLVENVARHAADNIDDNAESVPLTAAPLIGAPFRMISFVTKYVSGADLVDKNSGHYILG